MQPGQKEKWTVKVLGDDKEKINAEVLANMYDKSLDQFAGNSYYFQKIYQRSFILNSYGINENLAQENFSKRVPYLKQSNVSIPDFNWFSGGIYSDIVMNRMYSASAKMETKDMAMAAPTVAAGLKGKVAGLQIAADTLSKDKEINEVVLTKKLDKIQVRQNLNETAFFYPNLMTDKDGNVTFEFTSPEALTQWKLMFLAHTKDARAATLEKSVVTQKEFSVTPNYPRF